MDVVETLPSPAPLLSHLPPLTTYLQKYINALRLPSTIVRSEDEAHEAYHSPGMQVAYPKMRGNSQQHDYGMGCT
mgnify:CR=1 FL=1